MNKPKISKEEVMRVSGVGSSTVRKWFAKLLVLEVIQNIRPMEKVKNENLFSVSYEKVEALKLKIKSGDFKLKGLWKDESTTVKKSL